MCSYCLNTSLRLFVIGHYHKGKTTLLASLRGKKQSTTFDERAKRPMDVSDFQQLSPEGRTTMHITTSLAHVGVWSVEPLSTEFSAVCVHVPPY